MRIGLFMTVLSIGLLFCSVSAEAAKRPRASFASICKKVTPLRGALLKNAWPGHIGLHDARATGFAFVCASDCARRFPIPAYYSDGTLAFKLGYYGNWSGNGRPRAYCGAGGVGQCYVSRVRSEARARGRDGKVYLDFGDRTCRSAVPGVRNGGI